MGLRSRTVCLRLWMTSTLATLGVVIAQMAGAYEI